MKYKKFRRPTFSIILVLGVLTLIYVGLQSKTINHQTSVLIDTKEHQRGAHVFGRFDTTSFQSFHQNNIEWVTLVTWAYQDNCNSPNLIHNHGDSTILQKKDSSWIKRIELSREAGFKVFMKPHVWISKPAEGKWRSDIFPISDHNWEIWKEDYRTFILRYAKIAEQANAEMFCVGAELSRLTTQKSAYWEQLIQEVRGIYSGKITYAANWYEEYDKITFWDQLDFIGIQAYFPLVENKYPSIDQVSKGWNKYIPTLESVHQKYKRKILFTEMGYKSTACSAIRPWEWIEEAKKKDALYSTETQANCYQAFFNTIWNKKWFAGVHVWQLRSDFTANPKKKNLDFTPQGKPAEAVITKGFGMNEGMKE